MHTPKKFAVVLYINIHLDRVLSLWYWRSESTKALPLYANKQQMDLSVPWSWACWAKICHSWGERWKLSSTCPFSNCQSQGYYCRNKSLRFQHSRRQRTSVLAIIDCEGWESCWNIKKSSSKLIMVPRKSCKLKLQINQNLKIESISQTTLQASMRSFAKFDLMVFWRGGEVGMFSIAYPYIIESLPIFHFIFVSFPCFVKNNIATLDKSSCHYQHLLVAAGKRIGVWENFKKQQRIMEQIDLSSFASFSINWTSSSLQDDDELMREEAGTVGGLSSSRTVAATWVWLLGMAMVVPGDLEGTTAASQQSQLTEPDCLDKALLIDDWQHLCHDALERALECGRAMAAVDKFNSIISSNCSARMHAF